MSYLLLGLTIAVCLICLLLELFSWMYRRKLHGEFYSDQLSWLSIIVLTAGIIVPIFMIWAVSQETFSTPFVALYFSSKVLVCTSSAIKLFKKNKMIFERVSEARFFVNWAKANGFSVISAPFTKEDSIYDARVERVIDNYVYNINCRAVGTDQWFYGIGKRLKDTKSGKLIRAKKVVPTPPSEVMRELKRVFNNGVLNTEGSKRDVAISEIQPLFDWLNFEHEE